MAEQSINTNDQGNEGFSARLFDGEKSLSEQDIYVSLTYDELDAKAMMDRVKSPKAGAVVLFSGRSAYLSIHHTLTDTKQ